jgi:putative ABC transport system permease protein
MRDIVFDLRYAFRTLRRAPAFTIVAVLSLALGIAVNTAIFSVVNAILFGATPYPSPDRLVMIWETLPTPRGVTQRQPAVRNALDWADSNSVFEGTGLVELFVQASIWVADRPAEPVYVQGISSNLLTVLGVQPASGRPCSSEVPGVLLTDD